jgi:dephospho-CoA kinase
MKIVGLTGSIGMGKSTTAAMFAEAGVPVYDADAAVHALYAAGGPAAAPLEAAFPGVTRDGAVDRAALSTRVMDDPEALRRLEAIVHPLLFQGRAAFIQDAMAAGAELVVIDVPLLFETGAERMMHAVVVVSAPEAVQRERVLARPGMSEAKLASILARQLPDTEKRRRADFVIDTGAGLESAREEVAQVIAALRRASWKSGHPERLG